jgi:hypothetical protein
MVQDRVICEEIEYLESILVKTFLTSSATMKFHVRFCAMGLVGFRFLRPAVHLGAKMYDI